jgi:hypothetical protein
MGPEGRLFVSAPTLSTNEAIWTVDRNGDTGVFYRGLGRPQGLALDREGNVYVAACLGGRRGLLRITPRQEAERIVAANNLAGIAFSPLGKAILATSDSLYEIDLGVEGYFPF